MMIVVIWSGESWGRTQICNDRLETPGVASRCGGSCGKLGIEIEKLLPRFIARCDVNGRNWMPG